MTSILHKIEKKLYARGFSSPLVRRLLATQIIVTAVGFILGVVLSPLTLWPLIFGVGAGIAAYNFWHIARFAEMHIRREFSTAMGVKLFISFIIRLCLTGAIIFALVIRFGQPVVPLMAGLTSTIVGIVVWGVSKASRNPAKEA